jgi:hypothetical protein
MKSKKSVTPKYKDKMTLRFNLGRGENYKKWKLTTKVPGEVIYLEPDEVILELVNCKLYNSKLQANRIYEGAHKRVCSWIECEDVLILGYNPSDDKYGEPIHYNPKSNPYWTDKDGNDIDGNSFQTLITKGNKVFVKN